MLVIVRGGKAVDLSRFGLDHATREETYEYVRGLGVEASPDLSKRALLKLLAHHVEGLSVEQADAVTPWHQAGLLLPVDVNA
jgi:hypothetical protein